MLQGADIVQDWINQGMEKGMEKGEVKAIQEAILEVLSERFGIIKGSISKKLAAIDNAAVLRSLFIRGIYGIVLKFLSQQSYTPIFGGQGILRFLHASVLRYAIGS